MGTDISMIVPIHDRNVITSDLPGRLNAYFGGRMVPDDPDTFGPWTWTTSPPAEGNIWDFLDPRERQEWALDGPNGASVWIRPTAFIVTYCFHWQYYTTSDAGRQIERIGRLLAEFFEADSAILTPDDIPPYCDLEHELVFTDLGYDEFLQKLLTYRPPEERFEGTMIEKRQSLQIVGWFRIEPFGQSKKPNVR